MTVSQSIHLRFFVVLAVIVACGLAAPARAQEARIAIANPAKIFATLNETKTLKEKMEKDREALEQEEKDRVAAIEAARAERLNLKPDSPQYAAKNQEILQKSVNLEVWRQLQKADLQRQQKVQMKTLFDKIAAGVAEVAIDKGYTLVLAEQRTDFPEDLDTITVEQLRALINQRDVLYAGNGIDISDLVINALNAKYAVAK